VSLIHTGGGRTITLPTRAFDDPTLAKPPQRQLERLRLRAKHVRTVQPIQPTEPVAAKRYGPVKFLDMASDQCGWILSSGYRCGLKVHQHRAAYCGHHDDVAHGRAKPFAEAAE
jgi:hypothetical protein